VDIQIRPAPALRPEPLRRQCDALADALAFDLPRRGVRLVLSLRSPSWVRVSRSTRELVLRFERLPPRAPIEAGLALYPRAFPRKIPRAPAATSCPALRDALSALRSGETRAAAGQRLAAMAAQPGGCAAQARIAVGEAALRAGRPALAVEILDRSPPGKARDRLLAHAAFLAGDLSWASSLFARLGTEDPDLDLEVAADAHIAAGELERARRCLKQAAARDPGRATEIRRRLAEVRMLAGEPAERPRDAEPVGARWLRAQARYLEGNMAATRAEALALSRETSGGPFAVAASHLAQHALVRAAREAVAAGEDEKLVRLYLAEPAAFEEPAGGAQPCAAAASALNRVGLSVAAERAIRRCLRLHRAAGRERAALLELAASRRERGDWDGALRTLRYLAARDPLGAASDASFWLAFGRALARTGQRTEAARALRRAVEKGDREVRERARTALADITEKPGEGGGRVGPDLGTSPELDRVRKEIHQVWDRIAQAIRALRE
jgi:tetratricopeptide (TPR) repeat protein